MIEYISVVGILLLAAVGVWTCGYICGRGDS